MDDNKEIKNETDKHLVNTAKQSSIVFIGKFLGLFLGFAISFVLARFFGPTVVGQYSLVKSVVNIVVIFSLFGFDNGLVKYISKYSSDGQTKKIYFILRVAFIYAIIFSVVGALTVFLLKQVIAKNIFNDDLLIKSLFYGAWIIIPFTLIKLFGGVYRGFQKLKYFIIGPHIVRKLGFLVLLIFMYLLGIKETSIVILALLLVQSMVVIYLIIQLSNLNLNLKDIIFSKIENNKTFREEKKEFLAFSSTLILISFMGVILSRVDRIMIGIYKSSTMVGIYNIAARIGTLASFLLTSSNAIFSATISELYQSDKIKTLENIYSTITKWLIILTAPIILSMIFYSDIILSFFGQEYIKASNVLVLLALGQMISVSVGANGFILSMTGHEKLFLFDNFIMAITNIVLNIVLISRYGILGAALATCISVAVFNIIKVFQVKRLLNIIPYRKNYFHIIINFFTMIVTIVSINKLLPYDNIIIVIIITIINLILSVSISYKFKDGFDEIVFNKLSIKINRLFKNQ